MIFKELLKPVSILHSEDAYKTLATPRFGVMIHYDESMSDTGGLGWFSDPKCEVSYNRYYWDNGDVHSIADDDWAAWHAGACRHTNANSAFYGLSAATNSKNIATKKCVEKMIEETARIFKMHKWGAEAVMERIQGHDQQAIFTKGNTPKYPNLWNRLGRKSDPTGPNPKVPVIDMTNFRILVALQLKSKSGDWPLTGGKMDIPPTSFFDFLKRKVGF